VPHLFKQVSGSGIAFVPPKYPDRFAILEIDRLSSALLVGAATPVVVTTDQAAAYPPALLSRGT
jgi:hypothetical protein